MRLKLCYENNYQILDVDTNEVSKWVNISSFDGEAQEEFERRIQDEIEVQYNRPDYNNWRKYKRHVGFVSTKDKNGDIEINSEESIMMKAVDKTQFTKSMDNLEIKLDYEYQHRYYCNLFRKLLKPSTADMVIAIVLDGLTVSEYAESIGDKANNVSHRYRRAIKKLQKVFSKRPFYPSPKAIR